MASSSASSPRTREDACATLGIPVYATRADAKKSYRALARAFHPDKGGDAERFQAVQRAYELLEASWIGKAVVDRAKRGGAARARAPSRADVASKRASDDVDERRRSTTAPANANASASEELATLRDTKELGDEALALGDFARAIECYDAALAKTSRSASAKVDSNARAATFHNRARAHAGLSNWRDVLRDAEKAASLRGLWIAPKLLRGAALEALGRWRDAARCYQSCGAHDDMMTSSDAAEATSDAETATALEGLRRARDAMRLRSCVSTMSASPPGTRDAAAVTVVAFAPQTTRDRERFGSSTTTTEDQTLASGDARGRVRLWGVPSGDLLATLEMDAPDRVNGLAWGRAPLEDGTRALAAFTDGGALTLWRLDVSAKKVVVVDEIRLARRGDGVTVAVFDDATRQLAYGDARFGGVVVDVYSGDIVVRTKKSHKKRVNDAAFHATGWQLVTGGADGVARVWDLAGMTGRDPGATLHTLKWEGASAAVTRVSYTPCRRLILVVTAYHLGGSGGGSYRLLTWSAVSGRLCKWYDACPGPVASMSWHPIGDEMSENDDTKTSDAAKNRNRNRNLNALVTSTDDGVLRLWSVQASPSGEGKPLHECWEHRGVEVVDGDGVRFLSPGGIQSNLQMRRRGGAGGGNRGSGASLQCHTGPRTLPFARCTPFLEDFLSRRDVSLRPPLASDPRPRRLSTPTDAPPPSLLRADPRPPLRRRRGGEALPRRRRARVRLPRRRRARDRRVVVRRDRDVEGERRDVDLRLGAVRARERGR